MGQQLWKNLVGPQKVKQRITKKLHNFPLGICPKELKTRIQGNTCTPMLQQLYSQQPKGENSPNVH